MGGRRDDTRKRMRGPLIQLYTDKGDFKQEAAKRNLAAQIPSRNLHYQYSTIFNELLLDQNHYFEAALFLSCLANQHM